MTLSHDTHRGVAMGDRKERTLGMRIEEGATDWLVLLLAGLGISLAPHVYAGGMFMALAAAALARRLEPETDRRELLVVLGTAFLLASMVASIFPSPLAWGGMVIPVQVKMAVTGFLSRSIARLAMRLTGLIEARSDTIADRLLDRILPAKPPGGGP